MEMHTHIKCGIAGKYCWNAHGHGWGALAEHYKDVCLPTTRVCYSWAQLLLSVSIPALKHM